MIPAFIIFLSRMSNDPYFAYDHSFFEIEIIDNKFYINRILCFWFVYTVVSILLTVYLIWHIKKTIKSKTGFNERKVNFSDSKTQIKQTSALPIIETGGFYKVNSGMISYLLGTVFGSGTLSFVNVHSFLTKWTIFIVIQLFIYYFEINSSDSIPNIVIMIFRYDLISIENKYWVIVPREVSKNSLKGIQQIQSFGKTDSRNRLYMLENNKNGTKN